MTEYTEYDYRELTPSALDQAYISGDLTLERVRQAILSVDNDGYEGIPWSRGMRWIRNNQLRFLHLLRRSGTNVADFFRDNFLGDDHRSGYANQVLSCDVLIRSLWSWRREVFVRDMLIFGFTIDDHWLKSALNAGISRKAIGDIVIEKLRCETVDLSSSVVDFTVYEFLGCGSGRVERRGDCRAFFTDSLTYWSVLSDEQFWQAMQICARKVPSIFFGGRDYNTRLTLIDRLRARLSDGQVSELLATAAANLTSLNGCYGVSLMGLPLDDLLHLMCRVDASQAPELVIRTALRIGGDGGLEFLKEFSEVLSSATDVELLIAAYRQTAPLLAASNDSMLVAVIRQWLRAAIHDQGWIIGIVTEGMHVKRDRLSGASRKIPQLQVSYNGQIYIEDWLQAIKAWPRYTIQLGDLVACHPASRWHARRLTPKVTSVVFTPIVATPRT